MDQHDRDVLEIFFTGFLLGLGVGFLACCVTWAITYRILT